MKFGDYLRQQREQKAWTQPEAARRADIEQSYLSKLETGKSYPSEDIFDRLIEAYEIDTAEMTRQIASAELEKLREIREVRSAVLSRHKSEITFVRGWMIAGLALLMLGGACLGLAFGPQEAVQQFRYRSAGVLLPGEELTAFEIVETEIRLEADNEGTYSETRLKVNDESVYQELVQQKQVMMERIDQHDIATTMFRGDSFVEEVRGGKRYYQLYGDKAISLASRNHIFLALSLMFLAGSAGCFFISFRWK